MSTFQIRGCNKNCEQGTYIRKASDNYIVHTQHYIYLQASLTPSPTNTGSHTDGRTLQVSFTLSTKIQCGFSIPRGIEKPH